MLKSVYTSPHFELQFDTVNRIQFARFIGDVPDEEYKLSWEKGIRHAINENVNRGFFDQRQLGKIGALARGWAVVNAFPKIQKYYPHDMAVAIFTAEKVYERPAIQYLAATLRRMTGFSIEYFHQEEEALNWLKTVNTLPPRFKSAS